MQDDAGDWHDIDPELVETAEGLKPKYAASDLVLSDGGDATFAQMSVDGKDLQWQWPAGLPKPVVDGDTATYKDVVSNGDLVVTATPTGFSHSIVLREAPTEPVSFTTPIVSEGAKVTEDPSTGVLAVTTKGGDDLVTAPAPTMYDASLDPVTEAPDNVVALDASVAKVAGATELTLTPDPAFLADPSTQYPVTIDPSWSSYATGDTYVENADQPTNVSTAVSLQVGTPDQGVHKMRTFMNFGNNEWAGKHIFSATLTMRNFGSLSCAGQNIGVGRVTQAWTAPSLTWANQPVVDASGYANVFAAYGADGCPDNWASWDVTSIVQGWAANTATNFGLRLASSDETKNVGWRKYTSANYPDGGSTFHPRIDYTYNSYPDAPATPTAAPFASYAPPGSSTPVTYVGSTTPTLSSAGVSDADGSNLFTTFQVFNSAGTVVAACGVSTPSGGSPSCQVPSSTPLANGGSYYVTAVSGDGTDNGYVSSRFSFTVSAGTPGTPTITCPGVPDGSWSTTVQHGSVTCTISAPSPAGGAQTGWIRYSVGTGAEQRVLIQNSTDPAVAKTTVSVSLSAGAHTITARSESIGGVLSSSVDYNFGSGDKAAMSSPNGSGAPPVTTDRIRLVASAPPASSNSQGPTQAYVKWRLAGSTMDGATGWNKDTTMLPVTPHGGGVNTNYALDAVWDASGITKDSVANHIDARTVNLLDIQVCFRYTTGDNCTWQTTHSQMLRVPHAFGDGYPTTDVAGGQVALWTGEFQTDATDASLAAGATTLSVSRSAATYAGPGGSTASNVFGPGWVAALDGPSGGLADLQVLDHTRSDGTIVTMDGEGDTMTFAAATPVVRRSADNFNATADATTWPALDEDTFESGIIATLAGVGANTTLTLTELDGTKTVFQVATAPSASTDATFVPQSVQEAGDAASQQTVFTYDTTGRVARITAPAPAGVSCPAGAWTSANEGCRALQFSYGVSKSATTDTPGDVVGQVKSISSLVASAGDTTTPATMLASYKYRLTSSGSTSGTLASVTDERNTANPLTTAYVYNTDNDLTKVTAPGLAPISYVYAGSDNKLVQVTRVRPGDSAATTLTSVVYGVAVNGDGKGPDMTTLPNSTSSSAPGWGQSGVPTYGAAVFGADRQLTSVKAGDLSADDWKYADLSYTDARGYTLDTASYGAGDWQIGATDYDATGHPTRTLDAGEIAAIRGGQISASAAGMKIRYNAVHTGTGGAVTLPAGSVVTDTFGTARYAILNDGTRKIVRPWTHTTYDEGAPNGDINTATSQEFALPTTVTTKAVDGAFDTDNVSASGNDALTYDTISQVKTTYDDAVAGDAGAGWRMGLAGSTTQVMGGDGADIVSRTRYDARGRVIAQLQPKAGSDAGAANAGIRRTAYYTSGTTGEAGCTGSKAWDGAVCKTYYAAASSSGALPTTQVTGYNSRLQPLSTTESANGAVRTTTNTYRADDALLSSAVTATGLSGSTAVPATTYSYDTSTGLPTGTTSSGTGAADPITMGYDSWGRQTTYSAKSGETTTTSYDSVGRVASVVDPQGTATYTYDGTDAAGNTERRGLATTVAYSNPNGRAVSISGAYDADGTLVRQDLPGGISQLMTYDPSGQPVGLTYTGQSTPAGGGTAQQNQPWLAWAQDNDVAGRVRRDWTPSGAAFTTAGTTGTGGGAGSGYAREYRYDRAARLVKVIDKTATTAGAGVVNPDDPNNTTATSCQVRDYAFDANGNRTSLTRTPSAANGSCQGANPTGVTTKSTAYDAADRMTTTGYVYDPLGRVTAIPQADTPAAAGGATPGALTLGYYDTDAARTITQSGKSTVYTLDTAGRRSTSTTTSGSTTSTIVRHYTDGSDNPGWTASTDATSSTPTIERMAGGLSGDLGLTIQGDGKVQLAIANLHGDIVSQVTLPTTGNATGIDSWQDADEYGNTIGGTAGITPTNADGKGLAYGSLGAKERATDTTGLTLMGARLYNSTIGMFTSRDPVFGGNATNYGYPTDPINNSDISGTESKLHKVLRQAHSLSTCMSFGTAACGLITGISSIAKKITRDDAKGNFVRHFVWQIALATNLGRRVAKAMGDAHEWGLANDSDKAVRDDSRRDKKNNASIMRYLSQNRKGILITQLQSGVDIPKYMSALIGIANAAWDAGWGERTPR